MVKITNGINTFEVTRGAFEGIYSRQGYTIIDKKKDVSVEVPKAPEKTEEELFLERIVEVPLSQWKKEEVKMFAELKEIDLTGTKSINEAKGLLKPFLEGEE